MVVGIYVYIIYCMYKYHSLYCLMVLPSIVVISTIANNVMVVGIYVYIIYCMYKYHSLYCLMVVV